MRIFNGCAGVGANMKLVDGVDVLHCEMFEKIANANRLINPSHEVIVGDAYDFFQKNHSEFGAAWFSPNCQSHSKMVKATRHDVNRIPDMTGIYGLIIFLQHFYTGPWVVENVVPFYEPLIKPTLQVGRHLFWSNISLSEIQDIERPKDFINLGTIDGAEKIKNWLGINYDGNLYYKGNHCPGQVWRNCVHPLIGKKIMEQLIGAV